MCISIRLNLTVILLFMSAHRVFCGCISDDNETCSVSANATFSKDYVAIVLDFGIDVKPMTSDYTCSGIIDAVTLPLLGSSPICAFQNTRSLEIYPDMDGTITTGSAIVIKEGSIGNPSNMTLNITSITVNAFSQPELFKPVVTITEDGYQSICPADKHFVFGDYSRYSGYAQFTSFIWGLDTTVDNSSASAIIDANSALSSMPTNQSEIVITNAVAATNESILLKIINVFGDENNGTLGLRNQDSPVARILGENRLIIHSDQELYLIADLAITKCGPTIKNVSYHWNISQTGQSEGYNIANYMNGDRGLRIKANTLVGGNEFHVSVQMTYWLLNNQSGVATDFVVVDVIKRKLIGQIVGGDRCIGLGQNLVLKEKHMPDSKEAVFYQWLCKHAVNGEVCKSKNGSSVMNFPNTSTILVPMKDGNFTLGQRYKFTLTISRGIETASSSIIVTVESSVVPLVTVTTDRNNWAYDDKIVLRGIVYGDYSSIDYKWTVHDLFGNEIKELSANGSSSSDITTPHNIRNIVFTKQRNTLSKEQTYKFTLAVTVGNSTCKGSISERIIMPPRHGFFGVMPLQGDAYNTTFRLRSHGWIDRIERMPFQYRFGYMDSNGTGKRYLTTWRNYNIAPKVVLPSGNFSNKLNVFIEVRNSLGLVARRDATVLVYDSQNNYERLIKHFQETLITGEYDMLSTVIVGIIKSGMNNEKKRDSLTKFFAVIEKSSSSPGLALILADALWEIIMIDFHPFTINASNAVFTSEMKKKPFELLEKLYKNIDLREETHEAIKIQAGHFSQIINYVMPQPHHLSPGDASMLNSFKAASKSIAEISCASIKYNNAMPISINNTVLKMTSEHIDMTRAGNPIAFITLSKSFRTRYMQTKCTELHHLNCIGHCLSVTSFKNMKYFMLDGNINGLVTEIHQVRLIDLLTDTDEVFTASAHEYEFNLPIVKGYNKTSQSVQCSMQDPQTKAWLHDLCNSNKVTSSSGNDILSCKCSKLFTIAGIAIELSSNASSNPTTTATLTVSSTVATTTTNAPVTAIPPGEIIMLVLHGNCTKYLQANVKKNFTESLLVSLANTLQIDKRRIHILTIECGSIIVNMTIAEKTPLSSEPTKLQAISNLKALLQTGFLRVTLYDGVIPAVAPGVNVSIPPTIPPMTTKEIVIPDFKTNWMPLFVSFILVLTTIIALSAFVAWLHGRYYKNKRYTDINSNKKKPIIDKKVLNKKQKMKTFETIMEDSLANHGGGMAIGSAATITSRSKKKSRIGAIASLALPVTSNVMLNKNIFSADKQVRELPRLALDESSSESENETSFSEVVRDSTEISVPDNAFLNVNNTRTGNADAGHLRADSVREGSITTAASSRATSRADSTQALIT